MNKPAPFRHLFSNWRSMPGGVWILGLGSLFMDMSSELIHSLLPVFMVGTLGASMITVGFIEGIAEATASVMKVVSGTLSDFLRRRKFLLVLGYAMAAFTKPVFPLATSLQWVFAARFIDRVGKGIRGAPRDALVADITPQNLRGAAYGLRQALDSVGALLGPALAVVLMLLLANDIRSVMWIAVIPAFLCVLLLMLYIREPDTLTTGNTPRPGLNNFRQLPRQYWHIILLGSLFTLARFSDAFLILRAEDLGLALEFLPLVLIVMNLLYAGFAYPAGVLADHWSAHRLLLFGLLLLIAGDLLLARASTIYDVFAGVTLWGLHMAFTQGLFAKLVADTTPAHLRGSGFGIFNLVTGCALLLASLIAGILWDHAGADMTFLASAAFATVTLTWLLLTGLPSGKQDAAN